jgi:hypothetical protein
VLPLGVWLGIMRIYNVRSWRALLFSGPSPSILVIVLPTDEVLSATCGPISAVPEISS